MRKIKIKWPLVAMAILVLIVGYSYVTVSEGSIDPLGRLGFVKFANPDMYPGHPHSQLLAKYAEDEGSKTALVVHFAGSSNYRSYPEAENEDKNYNYGNNNDGNAYIIELAFIDTQGSGATTEINWLDSIKVAIFGIPDGRYKFKSDGKVFNTYDEAMNHVYELARENGQEGPIPIVWHGTARGGNPVIAQGCGFPLYFYIMSKEYGVIPAYVFTLKGMIYPYFNNPYRNFELQNGQELQKYYTSGELDYK